MNRRARTLMMSLGTVVAGVLPRRTDDLDEFIAGLKTASRDPRLDHFLFVEHDASFPLIAGRWAMSGFPTIVVAHKLAASLMSTTVPAEYRADVIFPWPAFAMSIPDGMLHTTTNGRVEPVRDVFVHRYSRDGAPRVDILAFGESSEIRDCEIPFESFGVVGEPVPHTILGAVDLDDHDRRVLALLGCLAIGVAIEMSDPSHAKPLNAHARMMSRGVRRIGEPDLASFLLTRDVKLDVREAVIGYAEHGGRSPTVQSMTRGHWKRQAYGPRGELRKWIQIAPYWRGPEDAPIAVRKHVIA